MTNGERSMPEALRLVYQYMLGSRPCSNCRGVASKAFASGNAPSDTGDLWQLIDNLEAAMAQCESCRED
jgi:hypothetical protein